VDTIVTFVASLSSLWIYAVLLGIAYTENIFPPSPSDLVIVFGGSLIGLGRIDFVPALFWSTLGSTLGFMTMYGVGDWFGLAIVEKHKVKFLPVESIHKVEAWFRRYGYWLIVANRFLSGTRAVISFFAGMSELRFVTTSILCFVSALVWNGILLYAGMLLGKNWKLIGDYLAAYSLYATVLIVFGLALWLVYYVYQRMKRT
jgi:membrane protein DedA with SNARE-associated domain